MDASQGLGEGGGRRGCGPDYVTSSLCAPPPRATRAGEELQEVQEGFLPPQRSPGHLLGMACDWGLYLLALRAMGANTRPLPPPPTPVWEARARARV